MNLKRLTLATLCLGLASCGEKSQESQNSEAKALVSCHKIERQQWSVEGRTTVGKPVYAWGHELQANLNKCKQDWLPYAPSRVCDVTQMRNISLCQK